MNSKALPPNLGTNGFFFIFQVSAQMPFLREVFPNNYLPFNSLPLYLFTSKIALSIIPRYMLPVVILFVRYLYSPEHQQCLPECTECGSHSINVCGVNKHKLSEFTVE